MFPVPSVLCVQEQCTILQTVIIAELPCVQLAEREGSQRHQEQIIYLWARV